MPLIEDDIQLLKLYQVSTAAEKENIRKQLIALKIMLSGYRV